MESIGNISADTCDGYELEVAADSHMNHIAADCWYFAIAKHAKLPI